MKHRYCDTIEFEKEKETEINEISVESLEEEKKLNTLENETDIIVNVAKKLSLDQESDYYTQTSSRPIRRDRGWSLREELLLKTWMKKSFGYRCLHSNASTYYKTLDNIFTYPIVFISSVFGMGGFALIGINPSDEDEPSTWEHILNYIIAFINLIVATLIMIQKINKYAEKSESHRMTATQYIKFHREINLELSLEHTGIDTINVCRKMKDKYDELLDNAPEIPTRVINRFNSVYNNSIIKPDITR